ncbi:MAG: undecaprenyldiphospho-muramoylpentapeptide beta-N-acetylglucosaminyltransferase, partial [Prolixibacteraceae bacterium]|nr:undecaprenyldiphospho-muramoylpentapeptide beta-N-acetylglucosaminyltransferase [Prolixibacteraceae bacterium]
MMDNFKVIISGGGTGGHIFPALSIAGEIRKRFPGAQILFVGAEGKMEMEKVPAAGFEIIGLPVIGFPRKLGINTFRFFTKLLKSMSQANAVVTDFKPDLVIGVGGYASGPVLRAATAKEIPALIQEQNSYAGITNKMLGRKVRVICVAYDDMERYFPQGKIVLTGNPIRQNLLDNNATDEEARNHFGLGAGQKTVLILGGSLGARTLNNAVLNHLDVILENPGISFIWQTGAYYYNEMVEKTKGNLPDNLLLYKFLDKMEFAYKVADVIISRTGASTVSELCVVGKPAILVPSPNVAEDHQTKNAMALVNKGAALMVKDSDVDNLLFAETLALINNPEQ